MGLFKIKDFKLKIIKYQYVITTVIIILLSITLRFVNYQNRWGLAYDQAHDALIARHAIETGKIPLLGPFSSAGPFQTGGEWYWIVMFGTFLYPESVITPWLFMTSLYVIFVLLSMVMAKRMFNEQFALFVGALAAVSPAQISQGVNLTNQTPQAFISLLAIWAALLYIKTKKSIYIFTLAFAVSFASSVHLQGAALIFLLLVTLLFSGLPSLSTVFLLIVGLILPWLPVLIVDIHHNFFNFRNMLQYYLHDQYAISLDVLGRRWLTYGLVFWPKSWGFVIGGSQYFGYLFLSALFIVILILSKKREIEKKWLVIVLSFLCMILLLRYVRTPLYDSYIVFLHPFILLLSGWVLYFCYSKSKVIAIVLLLVIFVGSIQRNIHEISVATNFTAKEAVVWRDAVKKRFPGNKLALYIQQADAKDKGYSLALFLDEQHLLSEEGKKIGLIATTSAAVTYPIITGKDEFNKIVDIDTSAYSLEKEKWSIITAEEVYKSTEDWYKE